VLCYALMMLRPGGDLAGRAPAGSATAGQQVAEIAAAAAAA
jgi:hypothetical protein